MFSRRQRLSRAAFSKAGAAEKQVNTTHFSLTASPNTSGYGVVVSKQVARLSVTRHRLKRQISAALRKLSLPRSLVVYARTGAPLLTYNQIQQELEAGLKRIA
jgi:ribonuclease P protein component